MRQKINEEGLEDEVFRIKTPEEIAEEVLNPGYSALDVEPGVKKENQYFGDSIKALRDNNYERHFFPWESFGMLVAYHEESLGPEQDRIAGQMLKSHGEWFDYFFEVKDERLLCYIAKERLEPEDVIWNDDEDRYDINRSKLRLDLECGVEGLPLDEWISLERLPVEFQERMYTRRFEDLPEDMRKGDYSAGAYLPGKDLWPVGRGYFISRYDVDGCSRASRGVRRKKFSSGNEGS